jgi:hypothetical protein
MKKGIMFIIMLILFNWVQGQSISVLTTTGYTNSDLFKRPLSIGIEYGHKFEKMVLTSELQFTNFNESHAVMTEYDMLWQYSYDCDMTVKTQIYSIYIKSLFYLKKNENVSILFGPTVGLGTYNGTEEKSYNDFSISDKYFIREFDRKPKMTFGLQFMTQINNCLSDRISLLITFSPKWMYLHNIEYYVQYATIPRSYIWTSFGVGLMYDLK